MMVNNNDEMPSRKPNRLSGYDYSMCGAYFVTVCVSEMKCLLWDTVGVDTVGADIIRPQVHELSRYGRIVEEAIQKINRIYPHISVDKYCIMPNHIHMIIFILPDDNGRIISAPTLSTVIGQMKRNVSRQSGISMWQKSFHDHIIRNRNGYEEIWRYIDLNPTKWELDKFYLPY